MKYDSFVAAAGEPAGPDGMLVRSNPELLRPRRVGLNPALQQLIQSKRVLMLQGPVGPFFDRLTSWLARHDIAVSRVVFQAGDAADCRTLKPIRYTGPLGEWPRALNALLDELRVDCVLLFGQARRYHSIAIQHARARGVPVVVLEEGYFRPGFATAELDAVNAHSTTLERFVLDDAAPGTRVRFGRPEFGQNQFLNMAWHAARHYAAMRLGSGAYPHYLHHRDESIRFFLTHWARSGLAKALNYRRDSDTVDRLAHDRYVFAPLQHDGDAQITHHSPFRKNADFIDRVLSSFARHAPDDTRLVFREHPMSRGNSRHRSQVARLARELGLEGRVDFLVEGHTPTLVRNAAAVVVINSTVGFLALEHRRPLKTLGDALYNQAGLSFPGPLDAFWTEMPPPSEQRVSHFLTQLRGLTQWPCNLYGRASEALAWDVEPTPAAMPLHIFPKSP